MKKRMMAMMATAVMFVFLLVAVPLQQGIARADNSEDSQPVCVFVVGIANNAEIEGKYLYGELPVIGISPYSGDLLRAVTDYLNPKHNGGQNGGRLIEDLEKVYHEKGRIDMAFFHSAAVVAMNSVPDELDDLLLSGKLRFGKIALAGVHVQPKLAAVLNKHKEKGNVGEWIALERTYVPGKQKGDLAVLFTTPNREFRSKIGAVLLKMLIAAESGIIKFPALISGGKWNVSTPFYDFKEHLVEVYTPDARRFFGIGLEKAESDKPPEALAQSGFSRADWQ